MLVNKPFYRSTAVILFLFLAIPGCSPRLVTIPAATDTPKPTATIQPTPVNTFQVTETATLEPVTISSGGNGVSISPDSESLAVATTRGIYIYNLKTGEEFWLLIETTPVNSVAFSPDGTLLATGYKDGTIRVWRMEGFSLLWTQEGYSYPVDSLAFSPDGQYLATGSWWDPIVKVWNAGDGSLVYTLEGHTDNVSGLAFSPDGKQLASGSRDGKIKLWRITDGTLSRTIDWSIYDHYPVLNDYGNQIRSIAFSPDGRYFAASSLEDAVNIWRVSDWYLIHKLQATEMNSVDPTDSTALSAYYAQDSLPAYNIAFSPDSSMLATGGYQTITLWNLSDYSVYYSYHSWDIFYISCLTFSPDGNVIVSTSYDENSLRISTVANGATFGNPRQP